MNDRPDHFCSHTGGRHSKFAWYMANKSVDDLAKLACKARRNRVKTFEVRKLRVVQVRVRQLESGEECGTSLSQEKASQLEQGELLCDKSEGHDGNH
ncbi:hypothetical protein MRX96_031360 [Rhipicephalus microplus]